MKTLHAFIALALIGSVAFADPLFAESEQKPPIAGQDVSKNLDETLDGIAYYSIEKRDKAAALAKKALDNFDQRLRRFEERSKERKEHTLAELKEERQKVAKHYAEMKDSTKEDWEAAKTAFLNSYHELERKFKDAAEKPSN